MYVFHWQTYQSGKAELGARLDQYSREHAAVMRGIQVCGALPTGVILFDMRAFKSHPHPRTYYEWDGDGAPCEKCRARVPGPQMAKASTEDVTLTRDLSLCGVPVYCNWDSWAGHFKRMCVGKPHIVTATEVGKVYKEAILKGQEYDDSIIYVGDPDWQPTPEELADLRARQAKGDEKDFPITVVGREKELSIADADWEGDHRGSD